VEIIPLTPVPCAGIIREALASRRDLRWIR
jgi:hypothetical protein